MPELKDILIIRYEDLRVDPAAVMQQVLDFVGTPGTREQIKQAVEFASYDNMKKLEEKRVFWASGARVTAGDRKNPNSYKVRRGKVGGYRDYFEDRQVELIDKLVEQELDPVFGYQAADDSDDARAGAAGV